MSGRRSLKRRADALVRSPPLAPFETVSLIPFLARSLDQCAFIEGDPKGVSPADVMCCGRPAVFGGSWCTHHRTIVFGPQAT